MRKPSLKRAAIGISSIAVFFIAFTAAQAAVLYFTPNSANFLPGETAILDLRIDPEGQCINVAEINVGFPKDLIKAIDVSRGESIFTLWISKPLIKQEFGLISLTGGVPGGYCGRVPGDPELTNVIAQLVLNFPNTLKNLPVEAGVNILPNSSVLLNDGFGTEAPLTVKGAKITISTSSLPQGNAWTKIVSSDKTLPEPFIIEIRQSKSVLDGKRFIVFSTVDKQSGLDRYEISETKDPKTAFKNLSWKTADSPYILQDQQLSSVIRVKAVDKAGNERIAEYIPKTKWYMKWWLWFVGLAPLLLAVMIRLF